MSVLELARALVATPSHDDETEAGDVLERWLRRETDATVIRDDAGNVLARRGPPRGGGRRAGRTSDGSLALVGHHDVVSPDESQVTAGGEYVVEQRDGRLYGRGSADMKGALAAAAVAFRDASIDDWADGELWFASFVGEEVGGVGARHAIEHGFVPDHAIVGEGSTNYSATGITDVVVAHRGRRGSTFTASGTAAHASEPEVGENAIYRAADAVDVLRGLEGPSVDVAGHTVRGSVVVTEIEGGSGSNVIPATCTVTVDERTVPGKRADLERVANLSGIEWTVEQDLPPMACTDERLVTAVLETAREVQADAAAEPRSVTKPHATDAGWLSEAGTECVVCGPSEPGEAHTSTESVSTSVLERCRRIYRTAAERWFVAE